MEAHLRHHLLDGEQAADQRIAFELDAEVAQLLDLGVDDVVRQAEVGNAVLQHPARGVEGFVDDDFTPCLGHVRGARHSGRPRADDADLVAGRLDVRNVLPALGDRHVADEALEPSDGDRLQRVAHRAHAFALVLLRAHSAADRRQQVGVGDDVVSAVIVLLGDFLDEGRDVDADRAPAHAGFVGALHASLGFALRILQAIAAGDLLEVLCPDQWVLFGHRRPLLWNGADRLLLRGHRKPRPS